MNLLRSSPLRRLARSKGVMERPAGIEAVQEKRGTCWSCGRKRSLALWYAAEEVTEA